MSKGIAKATREQKPEGGEPCGDEDKAKERLEQRNRQCKGPEVEVYLEQNERTGHGEKEVRGRSCGALWATEGLWLLAFLLHSSNFLLR